MSRNTMNQVESDYREHILMVRWVPHEQLLCVRKLALRGHGVFGGSCELLDPHPPCPVPCAPPAASPSPTPYRFTIVPMWPSIGFLRPPSRGVFQNRCVGQARVCAVESAAARICREVGRRETLNYHRDRHGIGFAAHTGQPSFGDRRTWFATARRHATGCGHHLRVPTTCDGIVRQGSTPAHGLGSWQVRWEAASR